MAVEMTASISTDFCEPAARALMNPKPDRDGGVGNLFDTHIPLYPGDLVYACRGKRVQDKIEWELPPITLF